MASKQTTLDLNGPILSFTQQPQSVNVCTGGTVTFVGIATATFPTQTPANPATNTGTLSYQWYNNGTALSNGTFKGATLSGTATTTLTVSNAQSPNTNQIQFYVGVDYIPSAYQSSSPVTAGTARSTGNAFNEILNSNSATLGVFPSVSVVTHPTDSESSSNIRTTFTTLGALTDTTQGSISYQWQIDEGSGFTDLSDGATVSGSGTATLSIERSAPANVNNTPLTYTIRAKLTISPNTCNSPIFTNNAIFTVQPVAVREIINYERVGDDGGFYLNGSENIYYTSLNFIANRGGGNAISFYAPEKDVRVRITLAGGAGQSTDSVGGEGGVSVFDYTLKQNTEYVFKLESNGNPDGSTNGGGGAFFYEKARLVVVSGGGGGAGQSGRGGNGGGIGRAGESGQGSNAGAGGNGVPNAAGVNPSGTTGGRASSCTVGLYYQQEGFSACADVGQKQWTGASGIVASQTAVIQRGYKAGTVRRRRNNGGNRGISTTTTRRIVTYPPRDLSAQTTATVTHAVAGGRTTALIVQQDGGNTPAGRDNPISQITALNITAANQSPCNQDLSLKHYLVIFNSPWKNADYSVTAELRSNLTAGGGGDGRLNGPWNLGSISVGDKTPSSFRVWACVKTSNGDLYNSYMRLWRIVIRGTITIPGYTSDQTFNNPDGIFNGGGGSGAVGGNGATGNGAGGGGGSGYADGTATFVSSTTGGNPGTNSYATITFI